MGSWDELYWPLPLWIGGRCGEIKTRLNVSSGCRGQKKVAVVERWPLALVEVRLYSRNVPLGSVTQGIFYLGTMGTREALTNTEFHLHYRKDSQVFIHRSLLPLRFIKGHAGFACNFLAEENRDLQSLFVNELLLCKALERHNFPKIN